MFINFCRVVSRFVYSKMTIKVTGSISNRNSPAKLLSIRLKARKKAITERINAVRKT